MAEVVRLGQARVDEKAVVRLINRYSSLRAAERALRPSVRDRRSLPTAALGRDLVATLQSHLEQVRALGAREDEEPSCVEEEVEQVWTSLRVIEAELADFVVKLGAIIKSTPIAQLRSTLPAVAAQYRAEAKALLDICLEVTDFETEPPFLVDYLITVLSSATTGGHRAIRYDPAQISPGVVSRCAEYEASFSTEGAERASLTSRALRNATMEVLVIDELEGMVGPMRELKRELGESFFDRDVLRSIVHYNVSVGNRFHTLFELEREQDVAAERTIAALEALDEVATGDAEVYVGYLEPPFASLGLRALEDALRLRLSGREPEAGAARDIVQKVDIDQLSEAEVEAFVDGARDSVVEDAASSGGRRPGDAGAADSERAAQTARYRRCAAADRMGRRTRSGSD